MWVLVYDTIPHCVLIDQLVKLITCLVSLCPGSKCPTGEFLYSIEAKDNVGIKKLFNDLSNHRPIFADDRLGRRMTLESNFHRTTPNTTHLPSRAGNNRYHISDSLKECPLILYCTWGPDLNFPLLYQYRVS